LVRGGLDFQKVLGFSGGALNGAAYFAGCLLEQMHHWRDATSIRTYRIGPRLRPLSLFSNAAIWDLVDYTRDEALVKSRAVCDLTVLSWREGDRSTIYSSFTPKGVRGWDGPLGSRLVASASIPIIFPPVAIDGERFRDGGVAGEEPISFEALADCKEVIVIHPVRPEEVGREHHTLWRGYEQRGRDIGLKQLEIGLSSLERLPEPPRIHRIFPSKILDFSMLSFLTRYCTPAVEQGVADGRSFLERLRI